MAPKLPCTGSGRGCRFSAHQKCILYTVQRLTRLGCERPVPGSYDPGCGSRRGPGNARWCSGTVYPVIISLRTRQGAGRVRPMLRCRKGAADVEPPKGGRGSWRPAASGAAPTRRAVPTAVAARGAPRQREVVVFGGRRGRGFFRASLASDSLAQAAADVFGDGTGGSLHPSGKTMDTARRCRRPAGYGLKW
jgi:hypothetical protein